MWIQSFDDFLSNKKKDGVDLITLHWTVGNYDQIFNDDYHFQIKGNGAIWADPRGFDAQGHFVPLAHAWHHNSKNIGISLCAMMGAHQPLTFVPKQLGDTITMYGDYPPQRIQYDVMCALVAKLMKHYNLQLPQIKTHYDLAQEDGYPGERWEFKYEKPLIMAHIKELIS